MSLEKECRICFENEETSEFINPCLCDGTSKWIHADCLTKWRNINLNRPANKACMECHYKYKIVKLIEDETFILPIFYKNPIFYILLMLILSLGNGNLVYYIDSNYTSLKMVTFNNNKFTNLLKEKMEETDYFLCYYESLVVTIYSNVFYCVFLLLSLMNINRKRLYLRLMYKEYIFGFFIINNLFYNFYLFVIFDVIESFFLMNFLFSAYNIFLTYRIGNISNYTVLKINTKYNIEDVINYEREEIINILEFG